LKCRWGPRDTRPLTRGLTSTRAATRWTRYCTKALVIYRRVVYNVVVVTRKTSNRRPERFVVVNDQMQHGYRYELVLSMGRGFHPEFRPQLTPKQMLRLGVFGGKYLTDCGGEFPADWFRRAKLCPARHAPELNYFKVNASLPLSQWKKKGWIYKDDPRGWFQWYCRYYMGRRIPGEDERQIARWKAMRRHIAQVKRNCAQGDLSCRRVQRQALLHWAYDSRKL
jgi:hypothetical protein